MHKQIDEAAANLLKLSEKVNKEEMNNPSFLMVVTGGQLAYKRPDDIEAGYNRSVDNFIKIYQQRGVCWN